MPSTIEDMVSKKKSKAWRARFNVFVCDALGRGITSNRRSILRYLVATKRSLPRSRIMFCFRQIKYQ